MPKTTERRPVTSISRSKVLQDLLGCILMRCITAEAIDRGNIRLLAHNHLITDYEISGLPLIPCGADPYPPNFWRGALLCCRILPFYLYNSIKNLLSGTVSDTVEPSRSPVKKQQLIDTAISKAFAEFPPQ